METGLKLERKIKVVDGNTAVAVGSGTLKVFATPALAALIEETAWRSVAPQLEAGQGTVGTLLNIEHLAPTPLGGTVRCVTELTAVDGRLLTFKAEVFDACGMIGRGTHQRFIIDEAKFMSKAEKRV